MGLSAGIDSNNASMTVRRSGVPVSRLWLRLAVALLLCLSAFGCGGDQGGIDNPEAQASTAPGQNSGSGSSATPGQSSGSGSDRAPGAPGGNADRPADGAPGAPGAPGDRGNASPAPGAPIKLPAFVELEGVNLAWVQAHIESTIRSACGGTPCVHTVVEQRDENYHPECFVRTDPATNEPSEVPSDSTLIIESGSNPDGTRCQTVPNSDPSDPQPPVDDTTPSDDTQPPSSL